MRWKFRVQIICSKLGTRLLDNLKLSHGRNDIGKRRSAFLCLFSSSSSPLYQLLTGAPCLRVQTCFVVRASFPFLSLFFVFLSCVFLLLLCLCSWSLRCCELFCLVNYPNPSWEVRFWQLSALCESVSVRMYVTERRRKHGEGGVSLTVLQDPTYVTACRHDGFAVIQALGSVAVALTHFLTLTHTHTQAHTVRSLPLYFISCCLFQWR